MCLFFFFFFFPHQAKMNIQKSEVAGTLRKSISRPSNFTEFQDLLTSKLSEMYEFRCPPKIIGLIGPYCEYLNQILDGASSGVKSMREVGFRPAGYDRHLWRVAGMVVLGNLVLKL
jgi:hypothetical protein